MKTPFHPPDWLCGSWIDEVDEYKRFQFSPEKIVFSIDGNLVEFSDQSNVQVGNQQSDDSEYRFSIHILGQTFELAFRRQSDSLVTYLRDTGCTVLRRC